MLIQSCVVSPPKPVPPVKTEPRPAQSPPPVAKPVDSIPQRDSVATPAPIDISVPRIPTELATEPEVIGSYPELYPPVETQVYPAAEQAPVIVSLLDQSDLYASQGEPASAAASLERGLRIEPRNALLWSRLATIRLQQQRYSQVESLAKKSNRFARGDYALVGKNWGIIAQARELRGDKPGAQAARRKAAEY